MQRLGPRADGRHVAARHDAKLAEGAAYRVSDIGRREMRVVALANAGVGVPELRRDHRERDALHREAARIGVPKRMEIDPWDNLALALASFSGRNWCALPHGSP